MSLPLDHLVITVPDLAAAVDAVEAATGIRPAPGGRHTGRGTHNALLRASWGANDRVYLELLARDPDQPDVAPGAMMFDVADHLSGPVSLFAWSVRTDGENLEEVLARGRIAGLDTGDTEAGARTLPSGEELRWTMTYPRPLALGRVQPFLLDWAGPHPTDGLPCEVRLDELVLEHPDAEHITASFRRWGVDLPVRPGPAPALRCAATGPGGTLTVNG